MFKKLKQAAGVAAFIGYIGIAAASDRLRAIRDRMDGSSNGVDDDTDGTARIRIEGLEGKIRKPVPEEGDLVWSRKYYNASLYETVEAINHAVAQGKHWRVWFLINRPYRHSSVPLSHASFGFDGNVRLAEVFAAASRKNDATSAYYFLKFAEVKPTTYRNIEGTVDNDIRDREVEFLALSQLGYAMRHEADDVVRLLLNTIANLGSKTNLRGLPHSDHLALNKNLQLRLAAGAAAQAGRLDYLDMLLARGADAEIFTSAASYMIDAVSGDTIFRDEMKVLRPQYEAYCGWLQQNDLIARPIAQGFVQLFTEAEEKKDLYKALLRKGWEIGQRTAIRSEEMETGLHGKDPWNNKARLTSKNGVTYMFNFEASSVEISTIGGAVTRVPLREFKDRGLIKEAHTFLRAANLKPRPLPWE